MEREGPCSQELAERDRQGMQREHSHRDKTSRLSRPRGTTRGSCTKFRSCSSFGRWKIRSTPSKANFPYFQWCGSGQWGGADCRDVTGEGFPNFPGVQEVKESPGTNPDQTRWFPFGVLIPIFLSKVPPKMREGAWK